MRNSNAASNRVLFNFGGRHPGLAEGFGELGMEVLHDRWQPIAAELDGCCLALVEAEAAVRRPWQARKLSRQLGDAGIPLALVDRDAPWYKGLRHRRVAWFRAIAGADLYATHSLQGCADFPYPALYLANAAYRSRYHLHDASLAAMREPNWYRWDVAFVGNLDAGRYREHRARVARMQDLEARLTAAGRRVRFAHVADLAPGEDIEIIQRSRINLQLGAAADDAGSVSWGLPERCYGIPACGGFLLSDRRLHAADDFRLGAEWAGFVPDADHRDLLARIEQFLGDLSAARNIAEAAYRRVLAEHGYVHRAQRLLDWAATFDPTECL
jgi:spore maturation protein CgeB